MPLPTEQPYLDPVNVRFDNEQGDRGRVKRQRQVKRQDGAEIKQTVKQAVIQTQYGMQVLVNGPF